MTSQPTVAAHPGHDARVPEPSQSLAAAGVPHADRNVEIIGAIRAHHAQLAEQVRQLTDAVTVAAASGVCARERQALHDWYRTELMPHVVAEERALYSAGERLDATRLLVRGMLDEHRHLVSLIAQLALATDPLQVAATAAATQSVFTVHLGKENDLLLPALDHAGVNLAQILDGMHEVLGRQHEAPEDGTSDSAGCGCGDGESDESRQSIGLQIHARPPGLGIDLDVRSLPHGERHEIIFGRLDALETGQRLVIVNDHDPKPLRYQTSALWPDRFEWSYLEAGPELWRVAISRVG